MKNIPYLDLHAINKPYKESFKKSMDDIFEKSSYIGGQFVESFEKRYAAINGTEYATGVSSGTDALAVILQALRLDKKGCIYYPENTFIGSILSGLQMGYKFKPYSINLNTLNADKNSLLDIGNDVSAVIVVYLYGHSFDIEPFVQFCKEREIPLIEDTSQAHFQEINGTKVGNFGDISFASLFPGKNIGATGDAGIICTNNLFLAERARSIKNYGMLEKHQYIYQGFNHRLDAIQAAFLSLKIDDYQYIINSRRDIAATYIDLLKDIVDVRIVVPQGGVDHSVWHVLSIVVDMIDRDPLADYLQKMGIGTNIHYPVFIDEIDCWKKQINNANYKRHSFYNKKLLSLPCYETMNKSDVEYVADAIRSYFE